MRGGLQLPGTVAELGTSLADVKVTDLWEKMWLAVVQIEHLGAGGGVYRGGQNRTDARKESSLTYLSPHDE
jgi:hypothetical protein